MICPANVTVSGEGRQAVSGMWDRLPGGGGRVILEA
jgi:hypothetical protein